MRYPPWNMLFPAITGFIVFMLIGAVVNWHFWGLLIAFPVDCVITIGGMWALDH